MEDAPRLTAKISAAPTVSALGALSVSSGSSFDALHHAALCAAVAKAARGGRAPATLSLFVQHARAWLGFPRGLFGRGARQAATILYSVARLQLDEGRLARALAAELVCLAPTLNDHDASITMWALATLGVADDALVRPIAQTAPRLAPSLNAQGAAIWLWALATLRMADDALVRPVALTAAALAPTLTAQGAANSLWALATLGSLGIADDALVRPIAATAVRLAPTFIAQDAANTLWALATLGVADDALVRPVAAAAARLAPTFVTRDAMISLWALATLGEADGALMRPIASTAGRLAPALAAARGAADWLWALAALGVSDGALVRPVAAAVERLSADLSAKGARQVLCADLVLGAGRHLSRALLDRCRAIVAACPDRGAASALQRDVAAALARLGYAPQAGIAVLGGLWCVDALLEPTIAAAGRAAISRRTAVQVDGPSHFSTRLDGAGKRELVPTGSTRLRNRLLREVAGLAVVCVTFVEWGQRGRDAAARDAWLAQLLAA